jgi:hypothetical protein
VVVVVSSIEMLATGPDAMKNVGGRPVAGGLGTVEEGAEGEETAAAFEPLAVKVWPVKLEGELADGPEPVEGGLEPPDGDGGATTAPADASAAAPNMMIDTAMANSTARLRRDSNCAFISTLGERNCGGPKHSLRRQTRNAARRAGARK